ncbi:MAG: 2,3-bisphosphoglycerate-independent phosphoglycerate mutase [Acidobacteriota bacterium]|nr:2,3-bisphosphoglycerate-independent phosphoglycerate mutase [Acidobacteriota bacterium]
MLLILSMSVLLIFVDGLGIGTRGTHNPLDRLGEEASPVAVFEDEEPRLPHGGVLARTDARLGVEGRPQSASGQTTILTGVNVPARLGFHKQGFPNEQMRALIRERSLFLQLARLGVGPNVFANAYTPHFFAKRPRWVAATTVAVEAAGLDFRTVEDLKTGRAVFHDFTNRTLVERGGDVPLRTPEEAADALARMAAAHRFTLYEHFIADRAGHEQNLEAALAVLRDLARFVRAVLARLNLSRTTVLLTSDHGNVEDLSTRNHTLNQVPTLAWGPGGERIRGQVRSLADITPCIISLLTSNETLDQLQPKPTP